MTAVQQSAGAYQALGLATIRLWGILEGNRCACGRPSCPPRSAGKHPKSAAWQKAAPDVIFDPSDNIGIRCGLQPNGLGLVGIDVDNPDEFAALQARLGPLPQTLTTTTGRGWHLLFFVPPSLLQELRNFTRRSGCDLRAEGGQCVAGPSLHYSGKRYETSGGAVAWLPPVWFAWAAEGCEARPGSEPLPCSLPIDDRWLALGRTFVADTSAEFPSSGKCWKLALRLRKGLCLPHATALALMQEWNASAGNPRPEAKLLRAVTNAAASGEQPWGFARPLKPGSLNHAESPEELQAPAPAPSPQLSLGALASAAPEPVEFAPKVKKTADLTASALSEVGARRSCKPAVRRLCEGTAFTDVKDFSDALLQLAYCQPDGVEWTAHSVQAQLQRCWVGEAGSFDVAAAWSNLLTALKDGDLGLKGLQEIFYRHPAWQGCLGYDELAAQAVWRKPPPVTRAAGEQVTDADIVAVRTWLEINAGGDPGNEKAWQVVNGFARSFATFNPLQDWLQALRWDGVPRIDSWLSRAMGAEPTQFAELAGAKWLVSAVARAMQPGCKADHALVLQGSQEGEGKSTVFERLAMRDEWFATLGADLGSKESKEMLRGKWILCLDELSSLRKSEYNAVKNYLTVRVDDYRAAYARNTEQRKRRNVFCATVNDAEFLNEDPERRWWPVAIRQLDLPWLLDNREQMWAEAFARWQTGYNFWDMPKEIRLEAQAPFRKVDVISELLQQWLNRATDPKPFRMVDALAGCGFDLHDQAAAGRLGAALRRQGYAVRVTRVGSRVERLWVKG